MASDRIVRDSDGASVYIKEQEAEQADLAARARRVILVDSSGNEWTTDNPLPVDTELTVNAENIILEKLMIEDISAGTQTNDVKITLDGEPVTIAPLGTSVLSSSVSIGTSATLIPTSALSNRKSITIKNNGSNTIFIGGSGVTTGNGYPLNVNESLDIDLDDNANIYGIVASGTEDLRILEFS